MGAHARPKVAAGSNWPQRTFRSGANICKPLVLLHEASCERRNSSSPKVFEFPQIRPHCALLCCRAPTEETRLVVGPLWASFVAGVQKWSKCRRLPPVCWPQTEAKRKPKHVNKHRARREQADNRKWPPQAKEKRPTGRQNRRPSLPFHFLPLLLGPLGLGGPFLGSLCVPMWLNVAQCASSSALISPVNAAGKSAASQPAGQTHGRAHTNQTTTASCPKSVFGAPL